MILDVVTYPNKILKQIAKPVTEFNEELHTLLDNMFDTMYHKQGIGLAAPQVGISLRLYILDNGVDKDEPEKMEIINPEFILKEGEIIESEGCLSLPGEYAYVQRYEHVVVKYNDRFGNSHTVDATDRLARILQHEYDHLEGIVFIDRLPPSKRETIKKHIKRRINSGDYVII